MALQHLRSSTADKRPTPAAMSDGQLAMNTNLASPGLFLKDSNGDLVKVGPVHVGTTAPNATPGAGGQAGNSKGEQWLDTSSSRYVFKIWDGTAWRTEDGEFVNSSGDTMTGALVMDNQQQVRFRETTANGTNFIAIQAPTSVAADRTLTLPDVTGTIVSTGDTGTVTSTMILDGTIVNADINASAAIVDTKLATIATAGKVSNSATTATNANTASAIVARDASGNFTAGTITAALTGAASSNVLKAGDTMTGALVVPLASAATPSLTFTGDTNTGIYSPGADTLAFVEGGVEAMRIDSSGRLLVGTSSTSASTNFLVTNGDAGKGVINIASTSATPADGQDLGYISFNDSAHIYNNAIIRAQRDGGTWTATTSKPTRLVFSTTADGAASPTERMRITSAGNVGIGTTAPNYQLHVTTDFAVGASGFNQQLSFTNDTIQSLLLGTGYTALKLNPLGGNVGIGTSSPATNVDVSSTTGTRIRSSYTNNSGGRDAGFEIYGDISGSFATRASFTYTGNSGLTSLGSSLDLAFSTASTERARIDSSGRLLVGTSTARSTFYSTASAFIQLEGGTTSGGESLALVRNVNDIFGGSLILAKTRGTGDTIVTSGDTIGNVTWQGNDGSKFVQAARIEAQVDGTPGADDMPGRLVFFTTADGQSTPTERMRIDAIGALKTSPNGTYKFPAGTTEITHNDATSSIQLIASSTSFTGDAVTISTYRNTVNDSYKFLSCIRQGFAVALEIRDDGDVYNVNGTYGSLSDAKLKENIIDAQSQWDDIRQLRVRNYNFKPETNNSTHKQIGVIAQEIEDVSPGLVNTVPDRDEDGNDLGTVTKSVNYSVLYMKAVKALQEAMERIEALEADVAQLKGA